MSPYLYPVIETAEIETTFSELAEQWQRETAMLFVTSKISIDISRNELYVARNPCRDVS
jgi:hypothetical protein